MKPILLAFILLFPSVTGLSANKCTKEIRIAVVDTGLDLEDPRFTGHICKSGHKDFTGTGLTDTNGHGTHISGSIQIYAGIEDYCLLIYKYYDESSPGLLNQKREVMAFKEAIDNGANIINFSGGGPDFSEDEYLVIKNNPKVTFVVAAGNEHQDLDIPGNEYYPASLYLPNEIVVANKDVHGYKAYSSNWGKRVEWEVGENVLSLLPSGKHGVLSGTSMSTAIFSGKLVDKRSKTCKYR